MLRESFAVARVGGGLGGLVPTSGVGESGGFGEGALKLFLFSSESFVGLRRRCQ